MPEPKQKTIAGHTFEISQPYDEGHTLTAIEAKVLNQVRSENIANNCREAVKKATEEGNLEEAAQRVREYDSDYVFTEQAAGGGRKVRDPVEREARKIARELIKKRVQDAGHKVNEISKEKMEEYVEQVSTNDEVVKAAQKRVREQDKLVENSVQSLELG